MKYAMRILSLLVVAAAFLALAACGQKANCNGISFGAGGGGSSSGGGVSSGGSVCGPGSNGGGGGAASDYFFYHGSNGANNAINTAALTATTFQVLPGISTNVGQSVVGSMVIVNKKFLYLPDQNGSGGITGFSINHSSGALTAITGSPFSVSPTQVTTLAADPDANGGRFLFAADFTSGDLLVFTIDPTTGALTKVTGSPFPNPGFEASSLAVDGTGKYLYASAGTTTGEVDGFLIDQTSGALSAVAGNPFFIFATQIQVDKTGTFLVSVDGGSSQIDVVPIQAGTGILLTGSTNSYPTGLSSRWNRDPSDRQFCLRVWRQGSVGGLSVCWRSSDGTYGLALHRLRILDRLSVRPEWHRAIWAQISYRCGGRANRRPSNRGCNRTDSGSGCTGESVFRRHQLRFLASGQSPAYAPRQRVTVSFK